MSLELDSAPVQVLDHARELDFMRNLNAHSVQIPPKLRTSEGVSAQIKFRLIASVREYRRNITSAASSRPTARNDSVLTSNALLRDVVSNFPTEMKGSSFDRQIISNSAPRVPLKYSQEAWERQRPEIERLYVTEGLQLPVVMARMSKRGFRATEPMYKRKFKSWGWRKYQSKNKNSQSSVTLSQLNNQIEEKELETSTSTLSSTNVSRRSTSHIDSTICTGQIYVKISCPQVISLVQDQHMTFILFSVKSLYLSSLSSGHWKTTNPRNVEEKVWDDFLVETSLALQDFRRMEYKIGFMGMSKAFKMLEQIINDSGIFAMPTIWRAFLSMIKEGGVCIKLAEMFLYQALELSTNKFGPDHPFVKTVQGLRRIEQTDSHVLEEVLQRTYRSCIDHVLTVLPFSHSTTLYLWADFVVHFHDHSLTETNEALDSLHHLISQSETTDGPDADSTLELLRMKLFILKLTGSRATEAEDLATEMLDRVDRRLGSGAPLKDFLLVLRRGLLRTLGCLYHARRDLKMAVTAFHDHIKHGVGDGLDGAVHYALEVLYNEMGEYDQMERIRARRLRLSEKILQDEEFEFDLEPIETLGPSRFTEIEVEDETRKFGLQAIEAEGENLEGLEDSDEIKCIDTEIQTLQQKLDFLQRRRKLCKRKLRR